MAESSPVDFSRVRIVIDPDGYRPNVGIVLMRGTAACSGHAACAGMGFWQFPQGGMNTDDAGGSHVLNCRRDRLLPEHVEVLGSTPGWLRYRLPSSYPPQRTPGVHRPETGLVLLRLVGDEAAVQLDSTDEPEFDHLGAGSISGIRVEHVVMFKRGVYARALRHLAPVCGSRWRRARIPTMPASAQQAGCPQQRRRRAPAPGRRGAG